MLSNAFVVCCILDPGPQLPELSSICDGASFSLLLFTGVSLCVRLAPFELLFLL